MDHAIEFTEVVILEQADEIARLKNEIRAASKMWDHETSLRNAEIARLRELLFAVVDELQLSDAALEMHGPRGTEPHLLVREVLAEKDRVIRNLKAGMVDVSEVARLREELAALQAKRRVVMCVWCGTTVYNYPTGEMGNEQHAAAIIGCREHDSVCPDNPLRQRAELAERREREAVAMLLAYCEHTSLAFTSSGPLQPFSGTQLTQLRALLSRAREQEQSTDKLTEQEIARDFREIENEFTDMMHDARKQEVPRGS